MTNDEYRGLLIDVRHVADRLSKVDDDEDGASLAGSLRQWASFTERWVNIREQEEAEETKETE